MKKLINIFIISLAILLSLVGFWQVNNNNYAKHIEIKNIKVNHPELLPDAITAKFASSGYSNVVADKYWLETIQYIGGNAMESQYKKYLYEITNLNPYFEKPYLTAELLLPSVNERYEDLTEEEKDKHLEDSIKIGEKGVETFCDASKIKLIEGELDLNKLSTDEKYKNPCKSSMVPYFLAYIYHFYAKDGEKAAKYYKITAANEDAPEGAKILAAIMQGKGGDREKSILMFLNMATNVDDDEQCKNFAIDINNTINSNPISGPLLQAIEDNREKLSGNYDDMTSLITSTSCLNFVNKATRELNLLFLDGANKAYFEDTGLNTNTPEILFDKGYIGYIPVDFQQEEHNGIIYFFNPDIGRYDYKMGY